MTEPFPTELGILICLSLFAASLWSRYIVRVNTDQRIPVTSVAPVI